MPPLTARNRREEFLLVAEVPMGQPIRTLVHEKTATYKTKADVLIWLKSVAEIWSRAKVTRPAPRGTFVRAQRKLRNETKQISDSFSVLRITLVPLLRALVGYSLR